MHPRRKQELTDAVDELAEKAAYLIDTAQSPDCRSYFARVQLADGLSVIEQCCDASHQLGGKTGPLAGKLAELEQAINRCALIAGDDRQFLKGRVMDAIFFGTGLQESDRSLLNAMIRDFRDIQKGM